MTLQILYTVQYFHFSRLIYNLSYDRSFMQVQVYKSQSYVTQSQEIYVNKQLCTRKRKNKCEEIGKLNIK